MGMYDIIDKKKRGGEFTRQEIEYFINGYVEGMVPDYQVAALLMAIYYQGMSDNELLDMTNIMANSGEILDLSKLNKTIVDKHSTGGVGDKVSILNSKLAFSKPVCDKAYSFNS